MKASIKSLLFIAMTGLTALSAQAQTAQKIVTINLASAFEKYYKTREKTTELAAIQNGAITGLRAADEERKQLEIKFNAQNLVLQRQDAKQADKDIALATAQSLQNDYNKKTNDMQQAINATNATLNEKFNAFKAEAVKDISDKAKEIAGQVSASLLLDSSNNSAFGTPTILWAGPSVTDITDRVVDALNAGHPMPAAQPATTAPQVPAVKSALPAPAAGK
jgi:Skp family chaperone for outer membrane proteins